MSCPVYGGVHISEDSNVHVRRLHPQNRTLWSQMHIRTYVHMCICDIGLAQGQAGRPPPDQKIQDREEMELEVSHLSRTTERFTFQ